MTGELPPPEIPRMLSRALLSLEGARRDPAVVRESVSEALATVRSLESAVKPREGEAPWDDISPLLARARRELEAGRAEAARDELLEVGRTIDRHVKGGHR